MPTLLEFAAGDWRLGEGSPQRRNQDAASFEGGPQGIRNNRLDKTTAWNIGTWRSQRLKKDRTGLTVNRDGRMGSVGPLQSKQ
jgi:hypothetical protein